MHDIFRLRLISLIPYVHCNHQNLFRCIVTQLKLPKVACNLPLVLILATFQLKMQEIAFKK